MSPAGVLAAVAGGVLLLLAIALATSYNRFAQQTVLVDESWSQVDVELQRRHDLIPNLVETVKGYAAHERAVLERVTAARVDAQRHRRDDPALRRPFEEEVGSSLTGLLAVAEAYPDLQASSSFLPSWRKRILGRGPSRTRIEAASASKRISPPAASRAAIRSLRTSCWT